MVPPKNKKFYIYAALWGGPGLIALIEAYRMIRLPKLQNTEFAEGPIGYTVGVGLLLLGFCIWEVTRGLLRNREQETLSKEIGSTGNVRKVWLSVVYMILFLVLIPIIGFVLANACFFIGCMHLLGCSLKIIIITVPLYCGMLYWLLPYLGLSLPRGIFGI